MSKILALKPHVSEKSYAMSEKSLYVFDVPLDANKHSVKRAVESQYSVTVAAVRTVVAKGKPKRIIRKRQQPRAARRSDTKKAYVQLKSGDRLPVFAEAE